MWKLTYDFYGIIRRKAIYNYMFNIRIGLRGNTTQGIFDCFRGIETNGDDRNFLNNTSV